MNYLRLFWVFVRLGVLNELAYRTNFYFQCLQSVMSLGTGLANIAVIFAHTKALGGWKPAELVALLGVYQLMGGLIGALIQPSMERFMEDVRRGTLDFTLTKPADAQVLVSMSEVRVWKLLDVGLGLAVLAASLLQLGVAVGLHQALGFGVTLLAGAAIVYSFWLILATLSFWFVRVENILIIFQGVYEAGRWPVGMYPRWLQVALTALVPVAFAVTVPAEAVVGRLTGPMLALALGLGLALLVGARWFWKCGVKRYSGASA